ncbi:hypothetical protein OG196_01790 [Kitasatospora purpeofusca]|uniref:hypothetical protein n=1 Tax=Kitasatospora purpeofusca TaxID=67352 RepID=UPI002E128E5E|nr:hypothetical protein OG715_01235 [Kitasatospora purpeofusca]WSR37917.1 hypothetical protein OG196_01790 [Kitasatospora purpeofusca]
MSDGGDHTYGALVAELACLVRLAHDALRGATAALADPAGDADAVPAAERALAELRSRIEEDAAGALDGRAGAVVAVHVGTEAETLGRLAQRLLEAVWARREREPVAGRLWLPLAGIAEAALELVAGAADVLESASPEGVADVLTALHEVGQRQRLLYELLLRENGTDLVDVTDLVLLSCCYQQCADRAGAIVRHSLLFSNSAV